MKAAQHWDNWRECLTQSLTSLLDHPSRHPHRTDRRVPRQLLVSLSSTNRLNNRCNFNEYGRSVNESELHQVLHTPPKRSLTCSPGTSAEVAVVLRWPHYRAWWGLLGHNEDPTHG